MKKRLKWIILCLVAVLMLCQAAWIYLPSEGEVTCYNHETGGIIRDPLTYEEMVRVKRILSWHIRWPEWIYGYPACAIDNDYAITIDGVCYMPARCCEMAGVLDQDGKWTYINLTWWQKQVLVDIITARDGS